MQVARMCRPGLPRQLLPGLLLMLSCAAQAQQDAPGNAAAEETVQAVEIREVKDPHLRPYRAMLKGVTAFEQHHALASQAALRFVLRAQTPLQFRDVSLRLAGPDRSVPIAVADDGTFALPIDHDAAAASADLVINQKRDTIRWRPDIHTPGLAPNVRRLGDLRLECEVYWAIEQGEQSFMIRNAINLVGGLCHSSVIRLIYQVPQPLQSATLVSGARREPLKLAANGKGYVPPLQDKAIDNDALIELQFAPASAAGG